jgi:hypothetical protein
MIFRTFDGEFVELNNSDYNCINDYNNELMDIYGIKNNTTNTTNNINQVDYIYHLISK